MRISTSEMDYVYLKTYEKTSYTSLKGMWLESLFTRWVLAAILDLCRLWELLKVATLATKLNLF